MKSALNASVVAANADQIAEALNAPGVETLYSLDQGPTRCFVCHGESEGEFLVFQEPITGAGFIVQRADIGESIHYQAREVLTA